MELEVAETWVVNAPSTKEGILDMVHQQAVDLIAIGGHGRHGLALLLGSTANAVRHGAPGDVLAVRIRDWARRSERVRRLHKYSIKTAP